MTILNDADQGVHNISDKTGTVAVNENSSQLDYSTNSATMPVVKASDTTCSASIGLITCDVGNVRKRVDYIDGVVVKDAGHSLSVSAGTHADVDVDGLEGLQQLLTTIGPNQALTLGINGADVVQSLVTDTKLSELNYPPDTISRTLECLSWPDGAHYLLLDHDPEPGRPELNADQFWSQLVDVCPEMMEVGRLVTSSTSSEIYDSATDECLKGAIGHHTYIQVRGDVNRFLGILKSRMWASKKAFFKLAKPNSKTGVASILERFLLDAAVFSPERIIYEAGAICGEGIEQRRSAPILYPGKIWDLDEIAELTEDESNLAAGNRGDAHAAIAPVRLRNAIAWHEAAGKSNALAYQAASDAIKRLDNLVLSPFHQIILSNGDVVAIRDLDDSHIETTCRDPQEPDYRGGAIVGKIYKRDLGGYNIHSQAHGGATYRCQTMNDWFADTIVAVNAKGERRLKPASKIADALALMWDFSVAFNTQTETFWEYEGGLWVELDRTIIAKRVLDALSLTGLGHGADAVGGVQTLLESKLAIDKWREKTGIVPLHNGVLELASGELLPHSPDNYLTWQLPYDFDPAATCDPIIEWLTFTQGGDQQRVQLLRAYLKAVITGRVDLQRFIELVGGGGTGKSTFANLAIALVGLDNCHVTELKRLETNRFETSALFGKRLVYITDSERYAGGVSVFKSLTGHDPLPFEQKYKQSKGSFKPKAMVILAANEAIVSSDYTSGLERRRLTVPFTKSVEPSQRRDLLSINDEGVCGEFAQYLPGLLNWVLALPDADVCDLVVNTAVSVPTLNADRLETLLASNPLAEWFDSKCVYLDGARQPIGNATKVRQTVRDGESSSTSWDEYQKTDVWMYASYRQYCDRSNIKPIALRRFGTLLADLFGNQLKRSDVVYHQRSRDGAYFEGIALRHKSHADIPNPITGGLDAGLNPGEELVVDAERTYDNFDDAPEATEPTVPDAGDVDTVIALLAKCTDYEGTLQTVNFNYPANVVDLALTRLDKVGFKPSNMELFDLEVA
jgi:P4 family phage/plasmid primase-like protien